MVKGQIERHSELGRQGNIAFASYLFRKERASSNNNRVFDSSIGDPYAEGLSLFDSAQDDLFYYQDLDSYESRFNRLRALLPVFHQGEKVRHFIQEIAPHLMVVKQELSPQTDWAAIERSCGFLARRFPLNPRFIELQQVATENLSLQETLENVNEVKNMLERLINDGHSPVLYETDDPNEDDLTSVWIKLDRIPLPEKAVHPSHQYYYREIDTARQSILDSGVAWVRRELEMDCRQANFDLALETLKEVQLGLAQCCSVQLPQLASMEREITERSHEYRRLVEDCESLIGDGRVADARSVMARLSQLAPENPDVPRLEGLLLQTQTDALIRQYHQWFENKQYSPILHSLHDANEGQLLLTDPQRRVWRQKVDKKIKRQRTKRILIAAFIFILIGLVGLFVAYPALFFRVTEFISHTVLGVEDRSQTDFSEPSQDFSFGVFPAIPQTGALLSTPALRRRSLETVFEFRESCFSSTYRTSRPMELLKEYLTSPSDLGKVRDTNLRLSYTPKDDSITGPGGEQRRLSLSYTF